VNRNNGKNKIKLFRRLGKGSRCGKENRREKDFLQNNKISKQ